VSSTTTFHHKKSSMAEREDWWRLIIADDCLGPQWRRERRRGEVLDCRPARHAADVLAFAVEFFRAALSHKGMLLRAA
jgi:hypothetical protein